MLADEYEVSKEEMYAEQKNKYDGYHFIFFSGMSAIVQCEVMMAEGRVDLVMRMGDKVYVCEFKVSASAKSAIGQIDRNRYYEPWCPVQRKIVKIGARFDVAERPLKDWEVEEIG